MIEPEERPDNLADLGLFGVSYSTLGVPFPVPCPKCKRLLTKVLLNELCTVDIRVECIACGGVAEGRNLWAQLQGRAKIPRGDR